MSGGEGRGKTIQIQLHRGETRQTIRGGVYFRHSMRIHKKRENSFRSVY